MATTTYTPYPYLPADLAFTVTCRCGATVSGRGSPGAHCAVCRYAFGYRVERLLPCGCPESRYASQVSSWCPASERLAAERGIDFDDGEALHHCPACKGWGALRYHRGGPSKDDPLGQFEEPARLETEPCPAGCLGGVVVGQD